MEYSHIPLRNNAPPKLKMSNLKMESYANLEMCQNLLTHGHINP